VLFHNPNQSHPLPFVQVAQFDISRRISIGDVLKKHPFSLSLHARQLRTNMHRFCTFMSFTRSKRHLRPLHMQQSAHPSCILQDGRWHTSEQLLDHDAKAQKAVRRVLSLIEENYAQELTLADMAAAAELSPNYFCRYFKKIAGCSPVEYLIDYRLNMAAYMLITTDDSISDISLACGFNDASHFIKFFRRKKGVTPRNYRQLHTKQTVVR
jgi:AraC-like DNA-binding protein